MGDIKSFAERYILDNLELMRTRPSVILHGDYHWENCIINDKGEIGIIDFSGNIIGDALEHLSYNNGENIDGRIFNASRMLNLFGQNFSADIPLFRRSVSS